MIKVIKQDLLKVTSGTLCHQTNCKGVMGSGVALAVRNTYPGVYKEYVDFCKEHEALDTTPLGQAQVIFVKPTLVVANVFGQDGFGGDGKMYTYYQAVESAFISIGGLVSRGVIPKPVLVPYLMGCDRGGGDWAIYSAIIQKHVPNVIACKL